MTMPTHRQSVIPMLNHRMANQCTKFKVSSFSHSGDVLGEIENLNGSPDHNHAPFRDGLSSVDWDYLWSSCVPNITSLRSHYEDIKGNKNAEIGVVWGLSVTQRHRQHSHSIERLSHTVFELLSFFFLKIWKHHMTMTTPAQGTVCSPNAKASDGKPLYKIWSV